MKHLTITILSILFSISATAQEADTTAAKGDKLNFEQPRFLVSDYFSVFPTRASQPPAPQILLIFSKLHGLHLNLHPKIEVMGKQKAIGKEEV